MEQFVGKYRVLAEFDKQNQELLPDTYYIECQSNGNVYQYSEGYLAAYAPSGATAKRWYNAMKKKTKVTFYGDDNDLTGETILIFPEKDFSKLTEIIKPKTQGKNIHPLSKRNMRDDRNKKYEIQRPILYKKLKDKLKSKKLKMHEYKAFYDQLSEKIDIDLSTEAGKHGLKIPEYIDFEDLYKVVMDKI